MNDNPTILIADDEELNQDLLKAFFQHRNYNMLFASNGKEAVEKTKEKKPDIILMDIQMPVMDGLEAIRILKGDNSTNYIPIIVLTAYTSIYNHERCLAAGADGYIKKPINLLMLANEIKIILNHKKSYDKNYKKNDRGDYEKNCNC